MATVRVESSLHERLRALSTAEQRPISQVIGDAIDRYEKERFWKEVYDSFARLRANPEAWAEYQNEAALWDTASFDGLEDEEPYFNEADANR